MVEISLGELFDKLTIVAIKRARIADADKQLHIEKEYTVLLQALHNAGFSCDCDAFRELLAVNETLWTIEDDIRTCEANGDFGPTFVALARRVYQTNDRRAAIKHAINMQHGSNLVETKSYARSAAG